MNLSLKLYWARPGIHPHVSLHDTEYGHQLRAINKQPLPIYGKLPPHNSPSKCYTDELNYSVISKYQVRPYSVRTWRLVAGGRPTPISRSCGWKWKSRALIIYTRMSPCAGLVEYKRHGEPKCCMAECDRKKRTPSVVEERKIVKAEWSDTFSKPLAYYIQDWIVLACIFR